MQFRFPRRVPENNSFASAAWSGMTGPAAAGFVENFSGLLQAPVACRQGLCQGAFNQKPGSKRYRYRQNSRIHN